MVLLLVVREGYGLGRFAWSASGLKAYHKFQPGVFVKRVVGRTRAEAALEIEDMSAAVSQLKTEGHPPFLGPLETPVCYIAVVSDPDGNSTTIHQRKPA
jgi:hypothetical protein